jgi:hypothetical protein
MPGGLKTVKSYKLKVVVVTNKEGSGLKKISLCVRDDILNARVQRLILKVTRCLLEGKSYGPVISNGYAGEIFPIRSYHHF